jgi:hypothetical protein
MPYRRRKPSDDDRDAEKTHYGLVAKLGARDVGDTSAGSLKTRLCGIRDEGTVAFEPAR